MATQLDRTQGLYLEDSYLLGIRVLGSQLRLTVLFALTKDHPSYRTPVMNEQHCYREGEMRWDQVSIVRSRGKPSVFAATDPDGTLDLGSLLYTENEGVYHIEADWLDLQFTAQSMEVVLVT